MRKNTRWQTDKLSKVNSHKYTPNILILTGFAIHYKYGPTYIEVRKRINLSYRSLRAAG